MIIHYRHQHPVGQGFFHAGRVLSPDWDLEGAFVGTSFRYVYDCGAMTDYETAREREIANYAETLAQHEPIDVLFISHAHADHINGVKMLLKDRKALTIMMPLLSHEERFAALARTLADDPGSVNAFYQDFIVDPAAALGTLSPDRIIFVVPGDGGAPGSGEDAPLEPVPDIRGRPDRRPMGWKPVGRGGPRPFGGEAASANIGSEDVQTVEIMSDTCALMLLTPTIAITWLLAPYVDPGVLADRIAFLSELADRLKISTAELETELASAAFRQQLVTDKSDDLKAAYNALGYNLNLTSLCLYSGPAEDYPAVRRSHQLEFGGLGWVSPPERQVAWLGTGDAALKQDEPRKNLLKHFGKHLDRVVTMTLPHHGSEGNFHPNLLARVNPEICIAAADRIMKWRHPGSRVVQLVASAGKLLFVTTSAEPSAFIESVQLCSEGLT